MLGTQCHSSIAHYTAFLVPDSCWVYGKKGEQYKHRCERNTFKTA
jgi:hypothetical protein